MIEFQLRLGTINLLSVYHDNWCGYFIVGSPESCSCKPEFELVEVTDSNAEAIAEKVVRDERRAEAVRRSRRN